MIQIQTKKIEGFSEILDFGKVSDILAKKLRVKKGSYFIIMNKLGRSVKDIQFEDDELRLKVPDSIKIGIKILNILERLHSIGIVHKDIKPDNMCFNYVHRPKVKERRNLLSNTKSKELIFSERIK